MRPFPGVVFLPLVGFLPLALTGCMLSTTAAPTPEAGPAISGSVHGAQSPIVGAQVYLLAANTTGYGNPSSSLLTTGSGSGTLGEYVTTNSSGGFSITGDYMCTANTQVYLYALGGTQGGIANPAAGLMAALGNCPGTAGTTNDSFSSGLFVAVNEVSTIAAAYAFAGFATDAVHVSSSGSALASTGIANAFATAANLETLGTGVALATTPAGNGTVPQAEINMLANILAACVNSNGAVTGGTNPTACYTLFTNAMSGGTTEIQPTDTATAAINMAHNPGTNVANLYGLSTANPPFAPALGSQPSDFTIALSFTGGGIYGPFSLAIDGLGNVWMVNTANSISEINGVTGAAISPAAGFTGNGLSSPFAIAIDPSNNAWVVNPFTYNYTSGTITAPTSVSEFTAAGGAATGSPFTGGGLNIAPNLNTLSPRDIAFDANGNAWIANNSASVTELNGLTGAAISPVTTGYSISSGIADPNGVAVDAKNHVWVCGFNGNTLYLVNGNTGALLGTSAYGAGGMEQPYSIAIDGSSNVWMPNQYDPNTLVGYTVSEFSTVTTGTAFSGGGILGPNGVAIDGLGNVWISNEIHVGSAPGAGLTEMNNSGAAVSPSTGYLSSALYAGGDVGVDGSGNVWIANAVVPVSYTNGLNVVEFVGAAAPVVTPLSVAVKNSKIGARP